MHPGDGLRPTLGMHWVAVPSTALSRGEPYTAQLSLLQPLQQYGGAYSLRGLAEPSSPSAFPSWWVRILFPGLVPPDDMVNSESVIPCNSGVVIGYYVDKFTHTLFAECFAAQSHIYPGHTGKVS